MTYADLAKLLDLPATDDPALQIRLLQERRAEQLDALAADLFPSAGRLRGYRLREIRQVEAELKSRGAPLEPEGGDDG